MHPKISKNWKGPYTINQKISDFIYEISRGSFGKTFNILRPYFNGEKAGT